MQNAGLAISLFWAGGPTRGTRFRPGKSARTNERTNERSKPRSAGFLRVLLPTALVLGTAFSAQAADHPEIYVTPASREAIRSKITMAPWAKTGFAALKARIDPLVAKTQTDPAYVSSRLMMNWTTHYTTPGGR